MLFFNAYMITGAALSLEKGEKRGQRAQLILEKTHMHVALACMSGHEARTMAGMSDAISSGPFEITDEQVIANAPRVRALQIQRLEEVWERVHVRIQEDEAGTRPLDPRFLEIGLRALKEEALIYRLNRLAPVVEEEEEVAGGVDRLALVMSQLAGVEEKLRESTARDQAREQG